MTVMLRKAMRDLRASALWFGLGGAAYAAGVLAYYPSVRDNASIDAFLKTYPKSLIEALGITDFSSFTGFLGAEVLNLMWPLVMAVFAILAGSALADWRASALPAPYHGATEQQYCSLWKNWASVSLCPGIGT